MSIEPTPVPPQQTNVSALALPPRPGYNGMAIAAFVLLFIFPPLGIVFGIIAAKQIQQSGERGSGLALFSIILGAVLTFIGIVVAAFVALFAFYLVDTVEKTSLDVNDLDVETIQTLTETAAAATAAQKSGPLESYSLPTQIAGPAKVGDKPNTRFSVPRDYTVFFYENGEVCVQFAPEDESIEADQGWWHVFSEDDTPREWGCPPLSVGPVRL